ncbi:cytochrome c oxidase subunit 3 [Hyphomicrobium methylovorum]|uniref:cytochrome c oxidase subunit 3 n=1 Tax=Hyphomicrobium methylovorum TaxID=84 RepID=UPI0015E7160F|nr:cytochrome c oxidase subunit 3 [Hyphomicrobium methylovorum]MBA2125834.1 cytochrome c oxidase subunit 3 [Hyphomicrobium methylovorum]
MADTHAKHHDYHLVDPSPWPLAAAFFALTMAVGGIAWMRTHIDGEGVFGITGPWLFAVSLALLIAVAWRWWADIITEANKGDHTPVVQLHLRYGMIMFIASEVMFFVAWFWAYFDSALFPAGVHELMNNASQMIGLTSRNEVYGGHWPPAPVETAAAVPGFFKATFNPWGLPLVNTLILLTSGCTVTWAHHALLKNDRRGLTVGLLLTVLLGVLFTICQIIEYSHAQFSFAGHTYGATFFMATGFHGFHVFIGTVFLAVCLFRAFRGAFTPKQHFGFEAAAWYWHFVDVVWLFLFACIYVWGAGPQVPGAH